jgi:hypothetical protein
MFGLFIDFHFQLTYKTFIDCSQTLLKQSSINLSHLISSQKRERESFILTKPCIPTKNLEIRIKKVLQTNNMKNLEIDYNIYIHTKYT